MNKLFEQCTVDGELTPELIKRKQELDQELEAELAAVDAYRGSRWVPKELQCADIQQKYEKMWEQELVDAGYLVRPVFEDAESWYDELSKLHEAETPAVETPEVDPFAEFNLSSSVEEALSNFSQDFELEYSGYLDEWDEDRWDPNSDYGHYTVRKSKYYDDYTYSLSPETVFEDVIDYIWGSNLDKYAKTESEKELVAKFEKLQDLCEDPEDVRLDIFVADHLDWFFDMFYNRFRSAYKEIARESNY